MHTQTCMHTPTPHTHMDKFIKKKAKFCQIEYMLNLYLFIPQDILGVEMDIIKILATHAASFWSRSCVLNISKREVMGRQTFRAENDTNLTRFIK